MGGLAEDEALLTWAGIKMDSRDGRIASSAEKKIEVLYW